MADDKTKDGGGTWGWLEKIGLEKVVEAASKVKFSGGMIGKNTALLITLAIVFGAMALGVRDYPLAVVALALILAGLVLYVFRRTVEFAEKNPEVALLEGAEFITYAGMKMASKKDLEVADQTEESIPDPEQEQLEDTPAQKEGQLALPGPANKPLQGDIGAKEKHEKHEKEGGR